MLKQVLWRLNSTLHKKGWKSIPKDILLEVGNQSFARLGLGQTKAIKGKKKLLMRGSSTLLIRNLVPSNATVDPNHV